LKKHWGSANNTPGPRHNVIAMFLLCYVMSCYVTLESNPIWFVHHMIPELSNALFFVMSRLAAFCDFFYHLSLIGPSHANSNRKWGFRGQKKRLLEWVLSRLQGIPAQASVAISRRFGRRRSGLPHRTSGQGGQKVATLGFTNFDDGFRSQTGHLP
jgi:hypothetical protein